jgi:tRNA(fMet)-specific endonuclease VapC
MLDTNICSFVMREQPVAVINSLQKHVDNRDKIVVSAITYAEMRFGAVGKKASPKHNIIVNEFMERVDAVLAWGHEAVDATTVIKKFLVAKGISVGNNDAMIAGHAIASGCILVTNNTKEFKRIPNLVFEDWVN